MPEAVLHCVQHVRLDTASKCDRYKVTVKEDDLVLMYSDGLSDNLYDEEMSKVINQALRHAQPAQDDRQVRT